MKLNRKVIRKVKEIVGLGENGDLRLFCVNKVRGTKTGFASVKGERELE
jgi:hypothetical protein